MNSSWNGQPAPSAVELARLVTLKPHSRRLLRDDLTGADYFQILLENQLWDDAIAVWAMLLPRRSAVWWGSLCVWEAVRQSPSAAAENALRAVVRWVIDPTEANRQPCRPLGEADNYQTSAGVLALAVAWSGGSMAPEKAPFVVAPPPHLTQQAVGSAILRAAVERDPLHYAENCRRYLYLGRDVAEGCIPWPVPEPVATVPATDCVQAADGPPDLVATRA